MMTDQNMKWIFSFTVFFFMIGWAVFTVLIIDNAAEKVSAGTIEQIDLIAASGTTGLLGALIGWNTMIIQHWFRKKTPE